MQRYGRKIAKKSLYRVNLKELNDKEDKVDKEAYNIASFSYIIVHSGWQKRWRLLDYCNVIVLNSMFCLNCDSVLIISLYRGGILRSVR